MSGRTKRTEEDEMASNVGEALKAAPVPSSAAAKERTKAIAAAAIQRRGAVSGSPTVGLPRPRLRVLAGVGLALVVIALTAPGQRAAAWVGDLLGVGDDPQPRVVQTSSVTIGTGVGPRDEPYSVVADLPEGGNGDVCMSLDWPDARKATTTCGYPPDPGARGTPVPPDQTALGAPFLIAASAVGLDAELGVDVAVVHGTAASGVADIEVAYRDRTGQTASAPVRLFALADDSQAQIAAPRPLKAYVAFPPVGALDSVRVMAYDADGQPMASYVGGDRLDTSGLGDRARRIPGGQEARAPTPSVRPAP
jgi:hypothetical protein